MMSTGRLRRRRRRSTVYRTQAKRGIRTHKSAAWCKTKQNEP